MLHAIGKKMSHSGAPGPPPGLGAGGPLRGSMNFGKSTQARAWSPGTEQLAGPRFLPGPLLPGPQARPSVTAADSRRAVPRCPAAAAAAAAGDSPPEVHCNALPAAAGPAAGRRCGPALFRLARAAPVGTCRELEL